MTAAAATCDRETDTYRSTHYADYSGLKHIASCTTRRLRRLDAPTGVSPAPPTSGGLGQGWRRKLLCKNDQRRRWPPPLPFKVAEHLAEGAERGPTGVSRVGGVFGTRVESSEPTNPHVSTHPTFTSYLLGGCSLAATPRANTKTGAADEHQGHAGRFGSAQVFHPLRGYEDAVLKLVQRVGHVQRRQ
jgi:hypothetical protein